MAEESTAWPGVSAPTMRRPGLRLQVEHGLHARHAGLYGSAIRCTGDHHDELTFGLLYAFTENFVLPLSHDEVVHGKGSLLAKMPGDDWQKFANLRAYYALMWGYPGKKLLFMGQEFAQRREWSEAGPLDWHLLDAPAHEGVQAPGPGPQPPVSRTTRAACARLRSRGLCLDHRPTTATNRSLPWRALATPGDPPVVGGQPI